MCVYVLKRVRSNYLFGIEQDSSGRYPSRKSVPLLILASSDVMAKCLITDLFKKNMPIAFAEFSGVNTPTTTFSKILA